MKIGEIILKPEQFLEYKTLHLHFLCIHIFLSFSFYLIDLPQVDCYEPICKHVKVQFKDTMFIENKIYLFP